MQKNKRRKQRHYQQGRHHRHAFTLIEILIALSVFSIVAIILSTSLYSIFNAREATNKHSDRLAELQIASNIITRDIQQIVNRAIYSDNDQVQPAMAGSPNMLNFTRTGYANPFNLQQRSNLQRVGYFLKDNQLIRLTWRHLDVKEGEEGDTRVLLENVDHLSFSYRTPNNKNTSLWTTIGKHGLPKAVQIHMHLTDLGDFNFFIPTASKDSETTDHDE